MTTASRKRVVVPQATPPSRAVLLDLEIADLRGETMGTSWSTRIVTPAGIRLKGVRQSIERVLAKLVRQLSAWEPNSDLSRFNRAPAGVYALPPEFFAVLDYALSVAKDTEGAYDPTIGALVAIWGFGPNGSTRIPPNDLSIGSIVGSCGWRQVKLFRHDRHAQQPGGMAIDVCAVAKGFAVDCVADVLRSSGFTDFLVEIGGELRGEGCKPDGSPWWVIVEPPLACNRTEETIIALHNFSVATSGRQYRYFEHDGLQYTHVIDPRSGYPTTNNVMSVTVLATSCMEADAISTALMVLGEDEGLAFAASRDIAAMFVVEAGGGFCHRLTPAFARMNE